MLQDGGASSADQRYEKFPHCVDLNFRFARKSLVLRPMS